MRPLPVFNILQGAAIILCTEALCESSSAKVPKSANPAKVAKGFPLGESALQCQDTSAPTGLSQRPLIDSADPPKLSPT